MQHVGSIASDKQLEYIIWSMKINSIYNDIQTAQHFQLIQFIALWDAAFKAGSHSATFNHNSFVGLWWIESMLYQ